MTAILYCDMCAKIPRDKINQINLRELGIYDTKQLKAKTGWTAHDGGIHVCDKCNELQTFYDDLKEDAIVDKLDRSINGQKNVISIEGEVKPPIETIECCDLCDFENSSSMVKKHRKAYHHKELSQDETEIDTYECPVCPYIANAKQTTQSHVHSTHKPDLKYMSTLFIHTRMTNAEYDEKKAVYDNYVLFICIQPKCNFLTLDTIVFKRHRLLKHRINTGRLSKVRVTEEQYQKLLKMDMIKIEVEEFVRVVYPVYECPDRECPVTHYRTDEGKDKMTVHQRTKHSSSPVQYCESYRTKWRKKTEED